MEYYLTKTNDDLDIWRLASAGYCYHMKRVKGDLEDLRGTFRGGRIVDMVLIVRYIIHTSEDLVELEGLAALETLENHG